MYLDQAIFELALEIEIQDAGTDVLIEYYTATEILRLLKEAKAKQEIKPATLLYRLFISS